MIYQYYVVYLLGANSIEEQNIQGMTQFLSDFRMTREDNTVNEPKNVTSSKNSSSTQSKSATQNNTKGKWQSGADPGFLV